MYEFEPPKQDISDLLPVDKTGRNLTNSKYRKTAVHYDTFDPLNPPSPEYEKSPQDLSKPPRLDWKKLNKQRPGQPMEPHLAPLTPRSRVKLEAPPTLPNMYLPKSASSSIEDDINPDSPLTPIREMK